MRKHFLGVILLVSALATAAPTFDTVYKTKTGDKYHTATCRYLKKSKIAIERSEAIKNGLSACSVCKP